MKSYHNLSALINAASQRLDQIDVVSFDVFDTLLVRREHNPDTLKKATARYIYNLAQQAGVQTYLEEIEQRRDDIENKHRLRNGSTYPDYEANYDQFMPEVLQSIFKGKYTEQLFKQVADYEIGIESSMLVPRTQFVDFIKELHAFGKKVLLISDMYLPAKYLARIMQDKGLADYFTDIVSSADTFNAKASGTAFPLIQQKHNIDITRWMHIGDNVHSDGLKATEFGLDAYLINDLGERHRKGLAARYSHFSNVRNFWKGRYIQQLSLPLESENQAQPALYVDGHNQFAYMMGYAMLQLKQRIVEANITKIYFCSREGWLFKQCWELMAPVLWPHLQDKVELHYLYVSRLALAKASRVNCGLTIEDTNIAFGPTQNKDFNDLVRIFGLKKQSIKPFLKKYDIAFDEVVSPLGRTGESYGKFFKLLHDPLFNQKIKQDAQADLTALESYLDSEGFFSDDNVALVDIGWLGTIQHYLTKAIEHRDDKPCVHGFMLAADRQYEYPTTDKSRYEGLLYDRLKFRHAPSVITGFKDVLEEICRADHPTLLAYKQDDEGNPKLQYRTKRDDTAKAETQQFAYYSPVHQGLFDGIQRFAVAMAITDFSLLQIREWLDMLLVSKIPFASTKEIQRLNNQSHQDDFVGAEREIPKKMVKKHAALWQQNSMKLRLPWLRWSLFKDAMRRLSRI